MEHKKYDLKDMAHIGIVTNDLEKYLKSFEKLFVAKEVNVYDFMPAHAYTYGKEIKNCKLKIAMIILQNGTMLEVIESISDNTPHKTFLSLGAGGLHHLAFYTEEFENCLDDFTRRGWDIVFKAEAEDQRGYRRCFYTRDEQINCLYEFVERPYKKV